MRDVPVINNVSPGCLVLAALKALPSSGHKSLAKTNSHSANAKELWCWL